MTLSSIGLGLVAQFTSSLDEALPEGCGLRWHALITVPGF